MIILSTGSIWTYGLNRIFEITQRSGFSGVELILKSKKESSYRDSWDVDYLMYLQETYKVKILSFHAPFSFEEDQSDFEYIINLAVKIGAINLVIHIPRKDQTKYIGWFQNEYLQNVTKYPISVLTENIVQKPNKAEPIYTSVNEIEQLPQLVFDTSYALRSNQDPVAMLSQLTNIKELHISHWNGQDDHMGILDNKDLYSRIVSLKKTNLLCLELCPKAFSSIERESLVIDLLSETRSFLENISLELK